MDSLGLAALLAVSLAAAPNANPEPSRLQAGVERVIVFKDGYGLVVKRASALGDADGRVFTYEVPEAVLGAFWAQAEGRELLGMRAEWVDWSEPRTEESACLTTLDLLRANPGRQVTLATDKAEIAGRIVQVLDAPPDPVRPAASGEAVAVAVVPRGGELVALDTPRGRLALPVAQIKSVLGPELALACKRTEVTAQRRKRLTFELGKAAAGKPVQLRIFYFASGVRWIPTYRLLTGDGPRAELSLQAELLNELEDVRGASVDLVVGVPNFKFKDTPSPLSLEKAMRHALARAAPGLMGASNAFSNAMFAQRAGELRGGDVEGSAGDESGLAGLAPELGAERRQDLFAYQAKGLLLPKGARATLPLWKTQVAQRHVYTLDLAVRRQGAYASAREDEGGPQRLQKNQVWHQLELSNPSAQPWTTGAALVLQGELPVAQELLPYTPPGGKSLLPLTVAVDVQSSHTEAVIERKPNALTVDGRSYTLVRKKGTIVLKSFRGEKSPMVVRLDAGGSLEAEGAKVVRGDGRPEDGAHPAVNGHATATWELTLEPKQSRTMTYQLSVYE